jgi:hypothetical protein
MKMVFYESIFSAIFMKSILTHQLSIELLMFIAKALLIRKKTRPDENSTAINKIIHHLILPL